MEKVELDQLASLVEETLLQVHNVESLSTSVGADSKLGQPEEWDSLSFVAIFVAVAAAYNVELADDDAFHFTSITAMHAFLNDIL
ncbi:hypothetical protein [Aurantiacibacter odishensis]|uniref:hypothetical protein n=1 Tax=Aurantiacibacter odishensis TaxID=1155476 RepID=UPI000E72516D|nr:hypothetical protein [Aurantiacibacter odishensis]